MGNQETYQEITNQILDGLHKVDSGKWDQPWPSALARPSNRHTGHAYSGVNVVTLLMMQAMGGYSSSEWLTYKQAQKEGGHVKKGESGTKVVYFNLWEREYVVNEHGDELDNVDPDNLSDGELDAKGWSIESETLPIWKTYSVFNVEQCEGIETSTQETRHDGERIQEIETWVEGTGIPVREGYGLASYNVDKDRVKMPDFETFDSGPDYYKTLFHEMIHATGHEERCDRDMEGSFGSKGYAAEELVAELGSVFLCADHGIQSEGLTSDITNSKQYVKSWINLLESDEYAIFKASSEAKSAVEWMHDASE